MKTFFRSGEGIENPIDANGNEIKEGDLLTFDWFDCGNPIEDMRRKFSFMIDWSDKQIEERISEATFIVEEDKDGILFGRGIKKPKSKHSSKMYLHDFRFKHTKIIREITNT